MSIKRILTRKVEQMILYIKFILQFTSQTHVYETFEIAFDDS